MKVDQMPSGEVIAGLMESGRLAMTQGRIERAITLYRRIGEIDPRAAERPEATLRLAQALEIQGQNALALAEYHRVTVEFPQAPQALMARAKVALLEHRVGGIPSTFASPMAAPVAAYITVSQIDRLQEQDLLRLRRSDTNTVVVEVARQAQSRVGGAQPGVYFKTDWAPVIQDRLAEIVASAHHHRLEAWAALSIRRMDWLEPSLGWSDRGYNPGSGELSTTNGLDLFHPAVWEYLLGLLMDLAATGIDGIFLMAEPPSRAIDGFSPFALGGYQRDMGQALDIERLRLNFQPAISSSPEFWRWIGWKQREQRKILDGVMRSLRKTYPALKVAIEVHSEAITNPRAALAWYTENILDLRHARADYIAVSLPMSQVGAVKPLIAALNGKRLWLTAETGSSSNSPLSFLPSGTGLIYKEKLIGSGLTKEDR
jgi:tetratricopeptide (TPR) repeat protein